MDNNVKADIEQMLAGAEKLIAKMDKMTRQTFKDISPEQAELFAKYFKSAKVGEKLKDIQKQTQELKKTFKDAG